MDVKAAGICGIPAELLKGVGEPMLQGLYAGLAVIWQSSIIFSDQLRGVVIPLRREKGSLGMQQALFSHASC